MQFTESKNIGSLTNDAVTGLEFYSGTQDGHCVVFAKREGKNETVFKFMDSDRMVSIHGHKLMEQRENFISNMCDAARHLLQEQCKVGRLGSTEYEYILDKCLPYLDSHKRFEVLQNL